MAYPSKGERAQITLRLPAEHLAHYQREADRLGVSLADYFAARMAADHDLPEPDYLARELARGRRRAEVERHHRNQRELPMGA